MARHPVRAAVPASQPHARCAQVACAANNCLQAGPLRDLSPSPECAGVFEAYFGSRWRATALGMSGDTVANVAWRLQHGELPRARAPRAAVLLAGTNDLRDAKVYFDHKAPVKGDADGAAAAVLDAAPGISDRCCCRLLTRSHALHTFCGCNFTVQPFSERKTYTGCC